MREMTEDLRQFWTQQLAGLPAPQATQMSRLLDNHYGPDALAARRERRRTLKPA